MSSELIDLPYYTDPNLNAIWIEKGDPSIDTLHQISAFNFLNQEDKEVTNKTFDNKLYVTNFFFSVRPNVCPRMTKNLHKIQAEFKDDERLMLVSHTVMPWCGFCNAAL